MKFYRDLFESSLNRVFPDNEKTAFFETFYVSVQREPSGHNLKHPTKWCPPNK